jgi:hypothetical protein
MRSIEGVVTIVQEARFQLQDDDGVGHQFVLGYEAPLEPEQLPSLAQRRVRVSYSEPRGLIGHRARNILLLEP